MSALFPILTDPNTSGFIPTIPIYEDEMSQEPHDFLMLWLDRWVLKYVGAWHELPSEKTAKPKQAVTDYAMVSFIESIVESEDKTREIVKGHNLMMSAENVAGNLLEEYIAHKISNYGWIWCRGEVLTAVDFCNDECNAFVQIKNKSNTENSSGKGYRESHNAPVWFRMYAHKKAGEIVYRWDDLIEIVKNGATRNKGDIPDDLMTEHDYRMFLKQVAQKNKEIITDADAN